MNAFDPQALKRLEDEIRSDIDQGAYDGVNIILARHGEIALRGTYGFAERASKRPSQADDVYRILSMSKAFTNALALRAIGEGKLALSTRVVDQSCSFTHASLRYASDTRSRFTC